MIYLDANATTVTPPEVIEEMVKWINCGNPSAGYGRATAARNMMTAAADFIASSCGFKAYVPGSPTHNNTFQVVFLSGATEANNTVIRSVVAAHRHNATTKPHIVCSAIEHKSIMECVAGLAACGEATVTYVQCDRGGFILPTDVEAAITPSTVLVCVMHANNETGAINNIKAIGRIAHSHDVPFFTDATQTFGKQPLNPVQSNVDAFAISFHKMHGVLGVGALCIRRKFIEGHKLEPVICGSQNCGFRGGTENIPGIAAGYKALAYTWTDRAAKNARLSALKQRLIAELSKRVPCQTYTAWCDSPLTTRVQLIFFGDASAVYLPNTLLFTAVQRDGEICNKKIKEQLLARQIIVSAGSACNTSSPLASHVVVALGVDKPTRKGTIRVSMQDDTTAADIDTFVQAYCSILHAIVNKK